MNEMKTITFNGQPFEVVDAAARASIDGLTPEQIGAAPSGYGLGSGSRWESLNAAVKSGWYGFSMETEGRPPHILYGVVRVDARTTSHVHQMAYGVGNTVASKMDGLITHRYTKDGGATWSEWEYENPPITPGEEYRTTERYLGKPVYVKLFNFGTLPNATQKKTAHNIENIHRAISVVLVGERDAGAGTDFIEALTDHNYISSVLFNSVNVIVNTSANVSSGTAYMILKYTKTTD